VGIHCHPYRDQPKYSVNNDWPQIYTKAEINSSAVPLKMDYVRLGKDCSFSADRGQPIKIGASAKNHSFTSSLT
jgi:hypothetical protein